MKAKDLKNTDIRRKDDIDDSVRTPGKDEVADYIETEIVEKGRWGIDFIEIADEVDYKRQTVSNVVRDYFTEDAGGEKEEVAEESQRSTVNTEIEIPEGVTNTEDYLRGVIYGLQLANTQ